MRMRGWLRQAAVAVAIQIVVGLPLALVAQSWTTPITWTAGQLVNEVNLNQQIRDNMLYLFNQLGATIPSGAILERDATTATGCWAGWSEDIASRGRITVSLPNGGTASGTVGTAFTDLENRTHTHSVPGLSIPGLSIPGLAFTGTGTVTAGGYFSIYQSNDSFAGAGSPVSVSGTTGGGTTGTSTSGTGSSGTSSTSSVMGTIQRLKCKKN